jgi:CRISPR-associated protein Cmr3
MSQGRSERATIFMLEPMDAWFFGDGRPFDATDPAQTSMSSLFPPMPQTVIGAVRAALALGLGWDGRSDWSGDRKIVDIVGSGDQQLGALTGAAVVLVRVGGQSCEPLFAVSHALLGRPPEQDPSKRWKLVRLRPRATRPEELLSSDLGLVRLPEPSKGEGTTAQKCDLLAGKYWLTGSGMSAFLEGGRPDDADIVPASEIFFRENRVGLALERGKRTAEKGALYRVRYVRPSARPGKRVGIAVILEPREARARGAALPTAIPFGGEGRMAWISTRQSVPPPWPSPPRRLDGTSVEGKTRYTVTLATPADVGDRWPGPGEPLLGLPGVICSACADRAVSISGWRGFGDDRGPRRSRALVPAGATWFMEASFDDRNRALARHQGAIGKRTEWGYGRIMIGTWN